MDSCGRHGIGPEKWRYRKLGIWQIPHDDKTGGLKGSLQHLLNVFIIGAYKADFVRWRQFKQNKALFRF